MPYSGLEEMFGKQKIKLLDILMLCKGEYVCVQAKKSQICGNAECIISDFGNNDMLMLSEVNSISRTKSSQNDVHIKIYINGDDNGDDERKENKKKREVKCDDI